ncbi:MAG: 6-pyruvoyl trahydropterin synthase family protein, partial [Limisphaerales bacterium]
MRARLTKDFTFEAAQTLPKAPDGHKCRRVHGHSFKVEVSVEGKVDATVGWIYDHANISAAMKPLLKILDHTYLNEIEG